MWCSTSNGICTAILTPSDSCQYQNEILHWILAITLVNIGVFLAAIRLMCRAVKQSRGDPGNTNQGQISVNPLPPQDRPCRLCGMSSGGPDVRSLEKKQKDVKLEAVRQRPTHRNLQVRREKRAVVTDKEAKEFEARWNDAEKGEMYSSDEDYYVPESEGDQEKKLKTADECLSPPVVCRVAMLKSPISASPQGSSSECSEEEEEDAIVPNPDLENHPENAGQLSEDIENYDIGEESQPLDGEHQLNIDALLEELDGELPGEDQWPFQLQQLDQLVSVMQELPSDSLDEQVVPDAEDFEISSDEDFY